MASLSSPGHAKSSSSADMPGTARSPLTSSVPHTHTTTTASSSAAKSTETKEEASADVNNDKHPEKVEHLVKSLHLQQQVVTIMRRMLPSYVAIEPSAVDLITDCMLEFASSMSYEAIITAAQEGRSLIYGKDFESAVRVLGFEDYAEPIAEFDLKRQRHIDNTKCILCSGKIDPTKKPASSRRKYSKKTAKDEHTTPNNNSAAAGSTAAAEKNASTAGVGVSSNSSSNIPAASSGVATHKVEEGDAVDGPVAMDVDQSELTKTGRKKPKARTNWFDPVFVEEFTRRMNEALSKDDPIVVLRQISREMHISMQILKQKFDEAKQMKMQSGKP